MKLAIFFVFAPLAFCQAAPEIHLLDRLNPPQDFVAQHFKSLKLIFPGKPATVIARVVPTRGACAIPLAQALPKGDKTDYKMPVFKPAAADVVKIGADPCPAPAR